MAQNARAPNCKMKFCYCKDRWNDPADTAVKPATATTSTVAHRKSDGVAAWVLSGFTAAFFASLARCSCINIATKDDADDCDISLPLIPADVIYPAAGVGYTEEEDHRSVEDNKDVLLVQ